MSINFDRALTLLKVAKEATGYPNLKWLLDAAQEELSTMEPKKPELPDQPGIIPRPRPSMESRPSPTDRRV